MQRTIRQILCCFVIAFMMIGPLAVSKTIATEHQQRGYQNTSTLTGDEKVQEILDKINETLVRNFMEYLVFDIGIRTTGTPGCQKAAFFIYDQFESMGLNVRYHNWNTRINRSDPDFLTGQNVEATQQGSDPTYDDIILFNAHYDTAKGTVGANDDGSGTVSVLAAAYVLSQYTFKRTMKFVAFSGEEQGLFGSEAYVRELYEQQTPVLVEFNADGIGRSTTTETGKKIRLSATEDTAWIVHIMQQMTNEYGLDFILTVFWEVNRGLPFGFSDYYHFVRHGYESISIWQADGDPKYHTPQDDITNINISYLVNMTRHIAATMAILADTQAEVPQVYITQPRAGEIIYKDKLLKTIDTLPSLIIDKTTLIAKVTQGIHPIDRVEFYHGNILLGTDTEYPYEYILNKRSMGLYMIKVVVYDTNENTATDTMKIVFVNLKNI